MNSPDTLIDFAFRASKAAPGRRQRLGLIRH